MQQLNPTEISEIIKQRIERLDISTQARNEGTIVSVSDGIVRIHGLAEVMYGEMIEFQGGVYGMALNLERDSVGAVVLGEYKALAEGQTCRCTGRVLEVPIGPALEGRVVDALGNPIDGKGPINATLFEPIEKVAPGVITRQSVSQPVQTGLKAIDAMVPVGRGQRELIIGDRQIGKTAIAIDAIINQKGTGVKCIYVAIGQKQSSIAAVVRKLEEHGAMAHTTVVVASASNPASMQYIAPFAGCTMGEYYRDRGQDALIIYDDLTKQAWAYRQISLLLRRPPGREAYPGDVFYLHSRLLERAARVNPEYVEKFTNGEVKGQTGSLTALPIIETQAGDVSAFVPTNVISITDGQIFLESSLFNAGVRPAMNAGLSVSRVGGAAQTSIIKKLGGGIRLALAQYRELAAFAQFASDLDEATRAQLEHGERVTELMKQKQYSPLSVAQMGVSLFAANEGYLKNVEVKKVLDFEAALHSFMGSECRRVDEQHQRDRRFQQGNRGSPERGAGQVRCDAGLVRNPRAAHGRRKGNPHQDRQRDQHAEDHECDADGGGRQDAQGAGAHGPRQTVRRAHPLRWSGISRTRRPSTSTCTCSSAR
jgi:F-type H+-transporting ATPase subunit alpha